MKDQLLRKRIAVLFIVACLPFLAKAQLTFATAFSPPPFLPNSPIIPVPNSSVNYSWIMFDHPAVPKAVQYELMYTSIAGKDSSAEKTVRDSSCSVLIGGFEFGSTCKWYYRALSAKRKVIFTSPEYTFTILPLPSANRVRVATDDHANNQGGFISFDYHCLIVDRSGKPVWFLPDDTKNEFSRADKVRDLRVTSAGTITFITQRNAFEIIPDGRTSWRAPKVGTNTAEALHHGIERLPNGHLMTLGNHTVRMPVPFDTAMIPVEFGVVVEYDRGGKIVWKWDSYSYLRPAEIEFQKTAGGQWTSSSHMNAFRQVSEAGVDYVYVGFRDLNRLIKIEKLTGKVVEVYGRRLNSGFGWNDDKLFAAQHDVTPLRDGNIAVFNNDSTMKEGVSSSLVVFAPGKAGQPSKLISRVACDFDHATSGKSEKCGGVDELPNGNLLVNFGNINRCVEMTRDGKIVWDAFAEYRPSATSPWLAAGQYRSHYCASLYPVWFSVALQTNTKKATSISIRNEGDAADRYTVEYFAAEKWILLAATSLPPEKQTTCNIPKVKGLLFTKIKVTSEANPDFYRTIDVK